MPDNNNATATGTDVNAQGQEPKTYTQQEVDALLQKEGDRRVASALKKKDAEFQKQLEDEKKEAQRLATLSAQEKEQEQLKKDREALDTERASLARERLEIDTQKLLTEKNLPVSFSDFLIGADAETTSENVKAFEKEFNSAVEKAVLARITTSAPASGGKSSMSKKEINEIKDPLERLKARQNNSGAFV